MVGEARRLVAVACRAAGLRRRVDDGVLLTSESVTAAVRYAEHTEATSLHLHVRSGGGELYVEVRVSHAEPRPRLAHDQLHPALADDWGFKDTAMGRLVWFRLRESAA